MGGSRPGLCLGSRYLQGFALTARFQPNMLAAPFRILVQVRELMCCRSTEPAAGIWSVFLRLGLAMEVSPAMGGWPCSSST